MKDLKSRPLLAIVILNTNHKEDTLECLRSLERSSYPNSICFVLDNRSSDGSVQAVTRSFPEAEIIVLTENLGYAGNNNVGIKCALNRGADWILVLNEDTVLAPDCLEELITAGEHSSNLGVLGPLVYHYDEPDIVQSAGAMMTQSWSSHHLCQNERDRGQFSGAREVDWVSGCAILVRRELIDQVGLLDPRFFYYWEETEWCLRARLAGWRIAVITEAHVWHKGVQRDYRPSPSVTYYGTRNRLLMMATHRAPLTAWILALAQTFRTLAAWTLRPKWRDRAPHRKALWYGLRDFLLRRWGKFVQPV